MAMADTVLFSWSQVEKLPELRRLELVLEALTDEELAASLEAARGRGRCRDFSADRGLDCGPLKAKLWQRHGVRPLIEPRESWQEQRAMPGHDPARPITRAPYPERADCIVYTEKGRVHCRCPSTGERRDLAFRGFDSGRNALRQAPAGRRAGMVI